MHRHRIGLLLVTCSLTVQGGGVFWTDRGINQLKRMEFDGSDLQSITLSGAVTFAGTNTRGLALDQVNERIFWADNGSDRILRANFDGSSSVVLTTIDGSSFPADVHLDPASESLFWCDRSRGHIDRADFDGSAISLAVEDAAATGPYFMDLDPVNGKLYWGDFSGGSIYRANPDGSQRETLLTGNNSTRGVRVDPLGEFLYWVNRNDKKIHRAPLGAFAAGTIPLSDPAVETIYEGLDTPHGLTIDIPARKLYWADTGTNAGEGAGGSAVSRGDLDGGTALEVIAEGIQPWDVELDRRCRNYQEWRRRCFRLDASASESDPEGNPDRDQFSNVLEYCFDLSPRHPDALGAPRVILVSGAAPGETYSALRYRRRRGTSDLVSFVQVSANLIDWSGSVDVPATVEVEVVSLADDVEEVTVRALEPVGSRPIRFMRVAVNLAP